MSLSELFMGTDDGIDRSQGSVHAFVAEPLTWLDYFNRFLECGRFRPIDGGQPCHRKNWAAVGKLYYHRENEYRLRCRCGCQYDVAVFWEG